MGRARKRQFARLVVARGWRGIMGCARDMGWCMKYWAKVIGKAWFGGLFGGIYSRWQTFGGFWNQDCGIGDSRYVSQSMRCEAEYGIL